MSAANTVDADELTPGDWAIIEQLRNGRNNAPNIAEETGYSAIYIRERFAVLKRDSIVEAIGNGIYELNEEQVPEH